MSLEALSQYIERLNLVSTFTLHSFESLRQFHLQHNLIVPFENLDIVLGRYPSLAYTSLLSKLTTGSRGGNCYELNGLLYYTLKENGFQVNLLNARRLSGNQILPRGHKCILLHYDGDNYLLDVGYRTGILEPLPMVFNIAFTQQAETFRLVQKKEQIILQKLVLGEWGNLFSFTLDVYLPHDFEPLNFWNARSPDSVFTNQVIVSRKTAEGSISVINNILSEIKYGKKNDTQITSAGMLDMILNNCFQIRLTRPEVTKIFNVATEAAANPNKNLGINSVEKDVQK